jgi:hypothetical protein
MRVLRGILISLLVSMVACGPLDVVRIGPPGPGITTDTTSYVATPLGNGQYTVRVIATFTNPTDTAVPLDRCGSGSPPVYSVALLWPGNDRNDAAYAPIWGCAGVDPLMVPPKATRVDTIILHGPNVYSNTEQRYLGVLAGQFQIAYSGFASNAFEIKLPR